MDCALETETSKRPSDIPSQEEAMHEVIDEVIDDEGATSSPVSMGTSNKVMADSMKELDRNHSASASHNGDIDCNNVDSEMPLKHSEVNIKTEMIADPLDVVSEDGMDTGDVGSEVETAQPIQNTAKKPLCRGAKYCAIAGCFNHSRLVEFRFFNIPNLTSKIHQREAWIKAIRKNRTNKDGSDWTPLKNDRVCSAHFVLRRPSPCPTAIDYVPTLLPTMKEVNDIKVAKMAEKTRPKQLKEESKLLRQFSSEAKAAKEKMKKTKNTKERYALQTIIRRAKDQSTKVENLKSGPSVSAKLSHLQEGPKYLTREDGNWIQSEGTGGIDSFRPLLQSLWLEDSSKDLVIQTSGGVEIKCHAAIFSLTSDCARKIAKEAKANDGAKLYFLDIEIDVVTEFLERIYCVETQSKVSKNLPDMELLLKSLNITSVTKKKPSDTLLASSKKVTRSLRKSKQNQYAPGTVILVRGEKVFESNDGQSNRILIKPCSSKPAQPQIVFNRSVSTQTLDPHEETQSNDDGDLWSNSDEDLDTEARDIIPGKTTEEAKCLNESEVKIVNCFKCGANIKTTWSKHDEIVKKLKESRPGKTLCVQYTCTSCNPNLKPKPTIKKKKIKSQKRLCPDCGKRYLGSEHDCKQTYNLCQECGKVFSSKLLLEYHMNLHRGLQPFTCPKCDFKSHSKYKLHVHKSKCTPKIKPPKCPYCPEPETPDHQKLHHGKDLPFACKECPYKAMKENTIAVHSRSYHRDSNKIQCSECPSIISARRLGEHMTNYHAVTLPIGCDMCGFRTETESRLEAHKHKQHTTKRNVPCEGGCGMVFTQVAYMRLHMRRYCKNSAVKKESVQN